VGGGGDRGVVHGTDRGRAAGNARAAPQLGRARGELAPSPPCASPRSNPVTGDPPVADCSPRRDAPRRGKPLPGLVRRAVERRRGERTVASAAWSAAEAHRAPH
jgi:hypothetical protein